MAGRDVTRGRRFWTFILELDSIWLGVCDVLHGVSRATSKLQCIVEVYGPGAQLCHRLRSTCIIGLHFESCRLC